MTFKDPEQVWEHMSREAEQQTDWMVMRYRRVFIHYPLLCFNLEDTTIDVHILLDMRQPK